MKRKPSLVVIVGMCLMLLAALPFMSACGEEAAPAPAAPAPAAPAPAAPSGPQTITPTTPAPAAPAAPAKPAKVYELNLSSQFSTVATQGIWLQAWADKINKESNGQIKIRIYPSSSLLASPDTWPGVARGVADLGFNFRYETFGVDMIQWSGWALVGEHSGAVGARTMLDNIKKFPEMAEEWSGNKVIAIFAPPPYQFNVSKEVKTLEDLEGLQLRAAGIQFGDELKALGITPVVMPMDEAYQAIQKGTVQGIFSPLEVLKNFRLADVSSYTAIANMSSGGAKGFLALNWDTYNSLPADLQDVIDRNIEETQESCLEMWNSLDAEAVPWTLEQGHKYYILPDAEMQKINDILTPVIKGFYQKLDDMGLPGTELYNFEVQELEKYNKVYPIPAYLSELQ